MPQEFNRTNVLHSFSYICIQSFGFVHEESRWKQTTNTESDTCMNSDTRQDPEAPHVPYLSQLQLLLGIQPCHVHVFWLMRNDIKVLLICFLKDVIKLSSKHIFKKPELMSFFFFFNLQAVFFNNVSSALTFHLFTIFTPSVYMMWIQDVQTIWQNVYVTSMDKSKLEGKKKNTSEMLSCVQSAHRLARKRNCCGTLNQTGRGKGTATDQRRWRETEIERHDKERGKEKESAASVMTLRLLFN